MKKLSRVLLLLTICRGAWAQVAPPAPTITSLLDKGGAVFNVKAYGAKGDGVTNDTTAINDAITAACASGGGTLFFPTSSHYYRVNTSGFVITCTLKVEGANGGVEHIAFDVPAQIRNDNNSGDIFDFNQNSQGSQIRNISLRGNATPSAGSCVQVNYTKSIDGSGMSSFLMDTVSTTNCWNGVFLKSANNVMISHLTSNANLHDGILFGAPNLRVLGTYFSDSAVMGNSNSNIELVNTAGLWLSAVQTFAGQHGILFDPVAAQHEIVSQVYGVHFTADATCSDALSFPDSKGIVNVVEFVDSWATAQSANCAGYGINMQNPHLSEFRWIGGRIRASVLGGVNLGAGTGVKFSNVTFSANGLNHGSNVSAITVAAGVSDFEIRDCLFGDVAGDISGRQHVGISIAHGPSTRYVIHGNRIVNGTAILLSDLGTGAKDVDGNFGGIGANQVASGTIGANSNLNVDLSTVMPTIPSGASNSAYGVFQVVGGAAGSFSSAVLEVTQDNTACMGTVRVNSGGHGSFHVGQINNCSVDLINDSRSATCPYFIYRLQLRTQGF